MTDLDLEISFGQLVIPALVFLVIVGVGGMIAAVIHRRRAIEPRLRQLQQGGLHVPSPSAQPHVPALQPLDKLGRLVAGAGVSPHLRQTLAKAGFFSEAAAPIYLGLKMLLLIVAAFIAVILFFLTDFPVLVKVVAALWGAGLLFFVPNLVVEMYRRKRTANVRGHLPDAVDLLEICVSSGMGIDMAWNAVTDEIRNVSTPLADEMSLANLEMQLGAPRATAMRNMAERTGAEELSSLVAMLVQSERFGTSIGDTLRMFAATMRETRSQHAEEAAEKLAVKLLFPMVLFIFPAMLITVVGPAGIAIADMISKN